MTDEQITQWAKDADMVDLLGYWDTDISNVRKLVQIVRSATLEEAAVKCDELYYKNIGAGYGEVRYGIASCAKELRGMK